MLLSKEKRDSLQGTVASVAYKALLARVAEKPRATVLPAIRMVMEDVNRRLKLRQIPQDRNFQLKIDRSAREIKLALQKGEERIDINQLAGPEVAIVHGQRPEMDKDLSSPEIVIPLGDLSSREGLYILFHEIGHRRSNHSEELLSPADSLRFFFEEALYDLLRSMHIKKSYPLWFLEKKAKAQAKSEKGAWDHANTEMSKLEASGFNVFAGYENEEQKQERVRLALSTYELFSLYERLFHGGVEVLSSYHPTFLTEQEFKDLLQQVCHRTQPKTMRSEDESEE